MVGHIGIVGCSAEGASLCYRTICNEGQHDLGPHAHPEVSLHTPSLARYVACLEAHDLDGVAELMLASADALDRAGADFLICPDNTIHQAMSRVVPRSPLPWLHIAEVVAEDAMRRGFRNLGLTGTKWLLASSVYPETLSDAGLDCAKPGWDTTVEMNRVIMDELVNGQFNDTAVAFFRSEISRMRDTGCDAVILGCTEIPLIIDDTNSPLPTLDSTRLLARAALKRAIGEKA